MLLIPRRHIPGFCDRCGKIRRRPDFRVRPRRMWPPRSRLDLMMAGGVQIGTGGVVIDTGGVVITDSDASTCCCPCYYQLKNCKTGLAVSKWILTSSVSIGDVIKITGDSTNCYTVSSTTTCSAPTTIVTKTGTMSGCSDSRCLFCNCQGAAPVSLTVTLAGVIGLPTSCCSFTNGLGCVVGSFNPNGTYTIFPTGSCTYFANVSNSFTGNFSANPCSDCDSPSIALNGSSMNIEVQLSSVLSVFVQGVIPGGNAAYSPTVFLSSQSSPPAWDCTSTTISNWLSGCSGAHNNASPGLIISGDSGTMTIVPNF